MKRVFYLSVMIGLITVFLSAVPPVPGKTTGLPNYEEYPSEIYPRSNPNWNRNLPQSILALMVEFNDVTFDLIPDYPDSLEHDKEYFERLLFHMTSLFDDASHGQYVLTEENYTVWENIITVSQEMGYYGDDDLSLERVCEFVQEVVEIADDQLDYNDYDAIMIIHAGAGQEADINGTNPEELFSTFLTRRSLQAGIDPENDDFPGIETNDGIILKELVIMPETEWQPDFTLGDPVYGLLGVICHQFGYQIGLPTLFDNDSDNGASAGIGSFGLMGTGVWNANGFVPPLPCAWSRYYLGWEDDNIIELNSSFENMPLTFPTADDEDTPKLYKINISDKEYFLLENRQQNPDGSMLSGDPSFTFALLPEGQQDVYPPGHPNEGQPKFNFMENTYKGCEWDFYLPGLGGPDSPVIDGSGMLIWHIDENIIDANFDPDFESNSINADASHKGIDLEEADGIQHLDTAYQPYSWGSPYDAYSEGNSTYFGKRVYEELFYSPIAESYYGGIPLEILDISQSDSLMTFSVHYEWSLNADYIGENPYPAAFLDFDGDGENEIFYPMPNGELFMWKDDVDFPGFPLNLSIVSILSNYYSFDTVTGSIFIPAETIDVNNAMLFRIDNDLENLQELCLFENNREWLAAPVINPDPESEQRVFLPLSGSFGTGSEIIVLDSLYQTLTSYSFDLHISSNLMLKEQELYFISDDWKLVKIDIISEETEITDLDIIDPQPAIHSALLADIDKDETDDVVILTISKELYIYNQTGSILSGFPVDLELNAVSIPSIADVDNNGFLDILIGGENIFAVVNKNGDVFQPQEVISDPDSTFTAAGVIAFDIDNDGDLEILGNMSRNRLCVWENVNNSNFELNRNYPVSFGERSLNYPLISDSGNENLYAYIPSNNGTIFRSDLPFAEFNDIVQTVWKTEYANLQRTASYLGQPPQSSPENNKIFNKKNTYFYPNPLNRIFSKGIDFNNDVPEFTIILRIETFVNTDVKIKIFDIAANLIYTNTVHCEAGFSNNLYVDAKDLSSGVYFAVLKAKGKVLKLKFAIEK
jgi:M6 family metalloprotease-like protein